MRPGKPRSPVLEHIEEREDLRSVSGWECPGSSGEAGRTATPRARRELTAQVVGQIRTEGCRLLHLKGEFPARVGALHGGQFRRSQHSHMSCSLGATRSPRDDTSTQPLRAKDGRVPILSRGNPFYLSLRAQRSDPYNNVDHSNPWCILHGEGAGRSWALSETSNISLR